MIVFFLLFKLAGCSKRICADDKLNLQLIDFNLSPGDSIEVSEFNLNNPEVIFNTRYYRPAQIYESTAYVYAGNNAIPDPACAAKAFNNPSPIRREVTGKDFGSPPYTSAI